ncbi:hypothetical protein HYH03_008331 [Edaphochlamys debaryana]|uniref:Uncharacterized protein n=1 Tax=Edaphochlamys debaryana TaxID=47281 RepID=A0A835XYR1_9CHLO|nr:hypothetical protein HYH03_008331 [Edaphochlamys debaryana]|eukprot:KAG2493517.1 hypothetical protein HYH03_008331 [Edaphochlamys debaryana]
MAAVRARQALDRDDSDNDEQETSVAVRTKRALRTEASDSDSEGQNPGSGAQTTVAPQRTAPSRRNALGATLGRPSHGQRLDDTGDLRPNTPPTSGPSGRSRAAEATSSASVPYPLHGHTTGGLNLERPSSNGAAAAAQPRRRTVAAPMASTRVAALRTLDHSSGEEDASATAAPPLAPAASALEAEGSARSLEQLPRSARATRSTAPSLAGGALAPQRLSAAGLEASAGLQQQPTSRLQRSSSAASSLSGEPSQAESLTSAAGSTRSNPKQSRGGASVQKAVARSRLRDSSSSSSGGEDEAAAAAPPTALGSKAAAAAIARSREAAAASRRSTGASAASAPPALPSTAGPAAVPPSPAGLRHPEVVAKAIASVSAAAAARRHTEVPASSKKTAAPVPAPASEPGTAGAAHGGFSFGSAGSSSADAGPGLGSPRMRAIAASAAAEVAAVAAEVTRPLGGGPESDVAALTQPPMRCPMPRLTSGSAPVVIPNGSESGSDVPAARVFASAGGGGAVAGQPLNSNARIASWLEQQPGPPSMSSVGGDDIASDYGTAVTGTDDGAAAPGGAAGEASAADRGLTAGGLSTVSQSEPLELPGLEVSHQPAHATTTAPRVRNVRLSVSSDDDDDGEASEQSSDETEEEPAEALKPKPAKPATAATAVYAAAATMGLSTASTAGSSTASLGTVAIAAPVNRRLDFAPTPAAVPTPAAAAFSPPQASTQPSFSSPSLGAARSPLPSAQAKPAQTAPSARAVTFAGNSPGSSSNPKRAQPQPAATDAAAQAVSPVSARIASAGGLRQRSSPVAGNSGRMSPSDLRAMLSALARPAWGNNLGAAGSPSRAPQGSGSPGVGPSPRQSQGSDASQPVSYSELLALMRAMSSAGGNAGASLAALAFPPPPSSGGSSSSSRRSGGSARNHAAPAGTPPPAPAVGPQQPRASARPGGKQLASAQRPSAGGSTAITTSQGGSSMLEEHPLAAPAARDWSHPGAPASAAAAEGLTAEEQQQRDFAELVRLWTLLTGRQLADAFAGPMEAAGRALPLESSPGGGSGAAPMPAVTPRGTTASTTEGIPSAAMLAASAAAMATSAVIAAAGAHNRPTRAGQTASASPPSAALASPQPSYTGFNSLPLELQYLARLVSAAGHAVEEQPAPVAAGRALTPAPSAPQPEPAPAAVHQAEAALLSSASSGGDDLVRLVRLLSAAGAADAQRLAPTASAAAAQTDLARLVRLLSATNRADLEAAGTPAPPPSAAGSQSDLVRLIRLLSAAGQSPEARSAASVATSIGGLAQPSTTIATSVGGLAPPAVATATSTAGLAPPVIAAATSTAGLAPPGVVAATSTAGLAPPALAAATSTAGLAPPAVVAATSTGGLAPPAPAAAATATSTGGLAPAPAAAATSTGGLAPPAAVVATSTGRLGPPAPAAAATATSTGGLAPGPAAAATSTGGLAPPAAVVATSIGGLAPSALSTSTSIGGLAPTSARSSAPPPAPWAAGPATSEPAAAMAEVPSVRSASRRSSADTVDTGEALARLYASLRGMRVNDEANQTGDDLAPPAATAGTQTELPLAPALASAGLQTDLLQVPTSEGYTQVEPALVARPTRSAASATEPEPRAVTSELGAQTSPRRAELGAQTETAPAAETSELSSQTEPEPVVVTSELAAQTSPLRAELAAQTDVKPAAATSSLQSQTSPLKAELSSQTDAGPRAVTASLSAQTSPLKTELASQTDAGPKAETAELGAQTSPLRTELAAQTETAPKAETSELAAQTSPLKTELAAQTEAAPKAETSELGAQTSPRRTELAAQTEPALVPASAVAEAQTDVAGRTPGAARALPTAAVQTEPELPLLSTAVQTELSRLAAAPSALEAAQEQGVPSLSVEAQAEVLALARMLATASIAGAPPSPLAALPSSQPATQPMMSAEAQAQLVRVLRAVSTTGGALAPSPPRPQPVPGAAALLSASRRAPHTDGGGGARVVTVLRMLSSGGDAAGSAATGPAGVPSAATPTRAVREHSQHGTLAEELQAQLDEVGSHQQQLSLLLGLPSPSQEVRTEITTALRLLSAGGTVHPPVQSGEPSAALSSATRTELVRALPVLSSGGSGRQSLSAVPMPSPLALPAPPLALSAAAEEEVVGALRLLSAGGTVHVAPLATSSPSTATSLVLAGNRAILSPAARAHVSRALRMLSVGGTVHAPGSLGGAGTAWASVADSSSPGVVVTTALRLPGGELVELPEETGELAEWIAGVTEHANAAASWVRSLRELNAALSERRSQPRLRAPSLGSADSAIALSVSESEGSLATLPASAHPGVDLAAALRSYPAEPSPLRLLPAVSSLRPPSPRSDFASSDVNSDASVSATGTGTSITVSPRIEPATAPSPTASPSVRVPSPHPTTQIGAAIALRNLPIASDGGLMEGPHHSVTAGRVASSGGMLAFLEAADPTTATALMELLQALQLMTMSSRRRRMVSDGSSTVSGSYLHYPPPGGHDGLGPYEPLSPHSSSAGGSSIAPPVSLLGSFVTSVGPSVSQAGQVSLAGAAAAAIQDDVAHAAATKVAMAPAVKAATTGGLPPRPVPSSASPSQPTAQHLQRALRAVSGGGAQRQASAAGSAPGTETMSVPAPAAAAAQAHIVRALELLSSGGGASQASVTSAAQEEAELVAQEEMVAALMALLTPPPPPSPAPESPAAKPTEPVVPTASVDVAAAPAATERELALPSAPETEPEPQAAPDTARPTRSDGGASTASGTTAASDASMSDPGSLHAQLAMALVQAERASERVSVLEAGLAERSPAPGAPGSDVADVLDGVPFEQAISFIMAGLSHFDAGPAQLARQLHLIYAPSAGGAPPAVDAAAPQAAATSMGGAAWSLASRRQTVVALGAAAALEAVAATSAPASPGGDAPPARSVAVPPEGADELDSGVFSAAERERVAALVAAALEAADSLAARSRAVADTACDSPREEGTVSPPRPARESVAAGAVLYGPNASPSRFADLVQPAAARSDAGVVPAAMPPVSPEGSTAGAASSLRLIEQLASLGADAIARLLPDGADSNATSPAAAVQPRSAPVTSAGVPPAVAQPSGPAAPATFGGALDLADERPTASPMQHSAPILPYGDLDERLMPMVNLQPQSPAPGTGPRLPTYATPSAPAVRGGAGRSLPGSMTGGAGDAKAELGPRFAETDAGDGAAEAALVEDEAEEESLEATVEAPPSIPASPVAPTPGVSRSLPATTAGAAGSPVASRQVATAGGAATAAPSVAVDELEAADDEYETPVPGDSAPAAAASPRRTTEAQPEVPALTAMQRFRATVHVSPYRHSGAGAPAEDAAAASPWPAASWDAAAEAPEDGSGSFPAVRMARDVMTGRRPTLPAPETGAAATDSMPSSRRALFPETGDGSPAEQLLSHAASLLLGAMHRAAVGQPEQEAALRELSPLLERLAVQQQGSRSEPATAGGSAVAIPSNRLQQSSPGGLANSAAPTSPPPLELPAPVEVEPAAETDPAVFSFGSGGLAAETPSAAPAAAASPASPALATAADLDSFRDELMTSVRSALLEVVDIIGTSVAGPLTRSAGVSSSAAGAAASEAEADRPKPRSSTVGGHPAAATEAEGGEELRVTRAELEAFMFSRALLGSSSAADGLMGSRLRDLYAPQQVSAEHDDDYDASSIASAGPHDLPGSSGPSTTAGGFEAPEPELCLSPRRTLSPSRRRTASPGGRRAGVRAGPSTSAAESTPGDASPTIPRGSSLRQPMAPARGGFKALFRRSMEHLRDSLQQPPASGSTPAQRSLSTTPGTAPGAMPSIPRPPPHHSAPGGPSTSAQGLEATVGPTVSATAQQQMAAAAAAAVADLEAAARAADDVELDPRLSAGREPEPTVAVSRVPDPSAPPNARPSMSGGGAGPSPAPTATSDAGGSHVDALGDFLVALAEPVVAAAALLVAPEPQALPSRTVVLIEELPDSALPSPLRWPARPAAPTPGDDTDGLEEEEMAGRAWPQHPPRPSRVPGYVGSGGGLAFGGEDDGAASPFEDSPRARSEANLVMPRLRLHQPPAVAEAADAAPPSPMAPPPSASGVSRSASASPMPHPLHHHGHAAPSRLKQASAPGIDGPSGITDRPLSAFASEGGRAVTPPRRRTPSPGPRPRPRVTSQSATDGAAASAEAEAEPAPAEASSISAGGSRPDTSLDELESFLAAFKSRVAAQDQEEALAAMAAMVVAAPSAGGATAASLDVAAEPSGMSDVMTGFNLITIRASAASAVAAAAAIEQVFSPREVASSPTVAPAVPVPPASAAGAESVVTGSSGGSSSATPTNPVLREHLEAFQALLERANDLVDRLMEDEEVEEAGSDAAYDTAGTTPPHISAGGASAASDAAAAIAAAHRSLLRRLAAQPMRARAVSAAAASPSPAAVTPPAAAAASPATPLDPELAALFPATAARLARPPALVEQTPDAAASLVDSAVAALPQLSGPAAERARSLGSTPLAMSPHASFGGGNAAAAEHAAAAAVAEAEAARSRSPSPAATGGRLPAAATSASVMATLLAEAHARMEFRSLDEQRGADKILSAVLDEHFARLLGTPRGFLTPALLHAAVTPAPAPAPHDALEAATPAPAQLAAAFDAVARSPATIPSPGTLASPSPSPRQSSAAPSEAAASAPASPALPQSRAASVPASPRPAPVVAEAPSSPKPVPVAPAPPLPSAPRRELEEALGLLMRQRTDLLSSALDAVHSASAGPSPNPTGRPPLAGPPPPRMVGVASAPGSAAASAGGAAAFVATSAGGAQLPPRPPPSAAAAAAQAAPGLPDPFSTAHPPVRRTGSVASTSAGGDAEMLPVVLQVLSIPATSVGHHPPLPQPLMPYQEYDSESGPTSYNVSLAGSARFALAGASQELTNGERSVRSASASASGAGAPPAGSTGGLAPTSAADAAELARALARSSSQPQSTGGGAAGSDAGGPRAPAYDLSHLLDDDEASSQSSFSLARRGGASSTAGSVAGSAVFPAPTPRASSTAVGASSGGGAPAGASGPARPAGSPEAAPGSSGSEDSGSIVSYTRGDATYRHDETEVAAVAMAPLVGAEGESPVPGASLGGAPGVSAGGASLSDADELLRVGGFVYNPVYDAESSFGGASSVSNGAGGGNGAAPFGMSVGGAVGTATYASLGGSSAAAATAGPVTPGSMASLAHETAYTPLALAGAAASSEGGGSGMTASPLPARLRSAGGTSTAVLDANPTYEPAGSPASRLEATLSGGVSDAGASAAAPGGGVAVSPSAAAAAMLRDGDAAASMSVSAAGLTSEALTPLFTAAGDPGSSDSFSDMSSLLVGGLTERQLELLAAAPELPGSRPASQIVPAPTGSAGGASTATDGFGARYFSVGGASAATSGGAYYSATPSANASRAVSQAGGAQTARSSPDRPAPAGPGLNDTSASFDLEQIRREAAALVDDLATPDREAMFNSTVRLPSARAPIASAAASRDASRATSAAGATAIASALPLEALLPAAGGFGERAPASPPQAQAQLQRASSGSVAAAFEAPLGPLTAVTEEDAEEAPAAQRRGLVAAAVARIESGSPPRPVSGGGGSSSAPAPAVESASSSPKPVFKPASRLASGIPRAPGIASPPAVAGGMSPVGSPSPAGGSARGSRRNSATSSVVDAPQALGAEEEADAAFGAEEEEDSEAAMLEAAAAAALQQLFAGSPQVELSGAEQEEEEDQEEGLDEAEEALEHTDSTPAPGRASGSNPTLQWVLSTSTEGAAAELEAQSKPMSALPAAAAVAATRPPARAASAPGTAARPASPASTAATKGASAGGSRSPSPAVTKAQTPQRASSGPMASTAASRAKAVTTGGSPGTARSMSPAPVRSGAASTPGAAAKAAASGSSSARAQSPAPAARSGIPTSPATAPAQAPVARPAAASTPGDGAALPLHEAIRQFRTSRRTQG